MTGTDVQDGLIDAARKLGFLVYHANHARGSEPGFPDLLLVGHGHVFALECKSRGEALRGPTTTKAGRVLPGQLDWLEAIASATRDPIVAIVRPDPEDVSGEDFGDVGEWDYAEALSILTAALEGWL